MPESIDKADNLDSAYRLVIVAAKRSKELQRGAQPRVESPARKSTTIAIQEAKHGKVDFELIDRRDDAEAVEANT